MLFDSLMQCKNTLNENEVFSMRNTITFLVGAGCEGSKQLGLPSGPSFKRDTIIAESVCDLIYKLNYKTDPVIRNGTIIRHNSISVLYQTICEGTKIPFTDEQQSIVSQYIELENGTMKASDKEKTEIRDRFSKLYKEEFYNKIRNRSTDERIITFLENAKFYSFVDSLFNYLREPDKYKKEINRVIKLYYAAYMSILRSFRKQSIVESLSSDSPFTARAQLANALADAQQEIIDDNIEKDSLYYNIIRKMINTFQQCTFQIVTTNYTIFAQRMTGLRDEDIAYVHGRMDLFEDVRSKHVAKLTAFSDSDFIFPFIFVQSGIKPIVNGFQIKEFEKARKMIMDSDVLIILGYGVNSDDEHISNLLRERLHEGKRINCFLYGNSLEKQNQVKSVLLSDSGIIFEDPETFYRSLSKIMENIPTASV